MNPELEVTADGVSTTAEALCPACGGSELERFFEIPELPTNCVALAKTQEAALNCPKAQIELGFCSKCGAVSNLAFDPSRLHYDPSYDNSLHFSPTFQKYADEIARHLVERYRLVDKNIIDLGCGNGEFLSMICGLGNNRGVGFDPSFIPGRADMNAGQGIGIVRDYYSERYADYAADFLICRHVLEHIAKPQQFLRSVRAALAGKREAAIFFELPNATFIFKNQGIWDIIYEHCFYYTSGALARLFSTCGFDVLKVSDSFNGQYLCLEAQISSAETGQLGNAGGDLETMRQEVLNFADEYRNLFNHWKQTLSRFASQHKRVALWGAGAKGAMFLNAFSNMHSLEYIVDVNPHKCGLYIPGTAQKVVSPEFLKVYKPDVLLIVNPNYRDEVGRLVASLGLTPDLVSI